LVSALLGIQENYDICWIGWPGACAWHAMRCDTRSRRGVRLLLAGVVVSPKEQPVLTGALLQPNPIAYHAT
jgi:hypothetical protein